MLITTLAPLLTHMSLTLDISMVGGEITLALIPKRTEQTPKGQQSLAPRVLSGTAEELDAALAQGADGPLGKLVVARRSLVEQLAAAEADEVETARAAAAARKTAAPKPPAGKPAASQPQQSASAIKQAVEGPSDGGDPVKELPGALF